MSALDRRACGNMFGGEKPEMPALKCVECGYEIEPLEFMELAIDGGWEEPEDAVCPQCGSGSFEGR